MSAQIQNSIIHDAKSPKFPAALCTGMVMGVLIVVMQVSFAALIFSGDMAQFASRAAGLTLFGGLAVSAIVALFSSFKSVIALPQDAPAAVLAAMVGGIAASMGTAGEATYATSVAVMALSTLASGALFLLIGQLKISNFFRFMPYPVVAGFLAGAGWLLALGSFTVMCGASPQLDAGFFTGNTLLKWAPGMAYGVALFLVRSRWNHFLILPVSLVAATVLFHATLPLASMTLDDAFRAGFLLSGMPETSLFPGYDFTRPDLIDWGLVLAQLPQVATVVLVALIGLLLNCGGIELASGEDMDLNQEFRAAGAACLVGGLGGCTPGAPSMSMSLMCRNIAAHNRFCGLGATLVVGLVLFAGGGTLKYFPLPVLGGLLLFLSLNMLGNWLIATSRKLPGTDYAILLVIFLVIVTTGFMEGVALGLLVTIAVFVIRFSRIDVIRDRFDLRARRSRKQRSVPHRAILDDEGELVQGYELSGYLFFGSAASLGERLRAGLSADPAPACLMLDYSGVNGFDISALSVFHRVFQAARQSAIHIVLAAPPERFLELLGRSMRPGDLEHIEKFDDPDQALEACEEFLIRRYEAGSGPHDVKSALFDRAVDGVMDHLDRQARFEDLVERLAPWLVGMEYAEGESLAVVGEVQPGLQLFTWGEATVREPETGRRMAHLVMGDVVAPRAAYGDHVAQRHVVADTRCRTALLTPDALARMERDDPFLALALKRHVILTHRDLG